MTSSSSNKPAIDLTFQKLQKLATDIIVNEVGTAPSRSLSASENKYHFLSVVHVFFEPLHVASQITPVGCIRGSRRQHGSNLINDDDIIQSIGAVKRLVFDNQSVRVYCIGVLIDQNL